MKENMLLLKSKILSDLDKIAHIFNIRSMLDDLRSFRHFFRHAYDTDIDPKKFGIVDDTTLKLKDQYKIEIHKFIDFINHLIED